MTQTRALPLLALLSFTALATLAGCQDRQCAAPRLACGDACVDAQSDLANCGACGVACDAGSACQAGACRLVGCDLDLSVCDHACVDLASDPSHCGGCGVACAVDQVCTRAPGGEARCAGACDAGLTPCGRACVDHQADKYHCGACGTACSSVAGCVEGACRKVTVACFSTDAIQPLAPDFRSFAGPRLAGDGPIALAALGPDLWIASSLAGSLVRLPLSLGEDAVEYALHGRDYEYVTTHQGLVFVANSGVSTLVVFDPVQARAVDEIPLVDDQSPANPKGIAFAGGKAYVSLAGIGPSSGQAVAVLDASHLDACATRAPADPQHCLPRLATLDVRAGADAAAGGLPFPGRSVTIGAKVYVVLANLKLGAPPFDTFYTDPAGPGRLAVIDSADDSVTYFTLPAGCQNPGGIGLHGGAVWVACGAFGASGLVRVDPAGPAADPVRAVDVGAPGNLAFCGPWGYVTDQFSGSVVRFRAAAGAVSVLDLSFDACPVANGFAWAADVACTP